LGNAQVLARRGVTLIRDEEPIPPLSRAVQALGGAAEEVRRALAEPGVDDRVVQLAVTAVGEATQAYRAGLACSGGIMVAQIRAIATDLLTTTKRRYAEGNAMVRRRENVGRTGSAAVPNGLLVCLGQP
jgi:hypothetical protein